ncbi:uncharacterized protein LOC131619607 [Vicia villosa]|uniref:uncharacterized protein LOC131619607 n=1 Tax=Vicia villosa TaxID=3911 RepID=UPI00273CB911|nr:uncharacterized protein LOC131619607 [Vicia villosa]
MASTQPLTSLLSSQGRPMSGSASFTRPPMDFSYPFQQTAGPSFSSYQQTGGYSFPPNTQVPPGFQQTGGSASFPPNTQVPPGFQQTGGSHTPYPTQVPLSFQQTQMPPRFQQTGGSHTPHPTHIPAREDDHVEPGGDDTVQDAYDVQSDGDDVQGEDDPSEIHIIDGRYYIWPAGNSFGPSRTAARCVYYVIQQMYKEAWTTFGDVTNKDAWFNCFKEKCTWDPMSEKLVKKNYFSRTSKRLSDTLRNVRKRWERDGSRPGWLGQEVLEKLIAYWNSKEFKAKSENAKKMRASEKGGHLNAVGSISTYEHSRRMAKRLGRQPLMIELVKETRTKKSGDLVDERTRKALEDYQTKLVNFLVANPKYTPREGVPLHPDVDFYIWSEVIDGKGPNGCFFGAGNLAGSLRSGDRNLFQRVRDGEGSSRPTQLAPQVMETIRQLALTEARRELAQREAELKAQMDEREAALKAQVEGQQRQIEAMAKMQAEMQQQQIEAMAKMQAEMQQQMRLFMQSQQSGGQPSRGNVGAADTEQENDHDFNLDNYPDPDDDFLG